MINNFKEPNLNAPRYRPKIITLLNKKTYNEFKEMYPMFANIEDSVLKEIIKIFNKKIWQGVIEHRDGVELPNSLGYLFIGTCKPAKTVNTNYALSKKYGKVIQNHNWETDGNLGKIFYTNYTSKYRFKNRDLWRFQAHRDFKRTVAKTYPEQWTKYIFMNKKKKVSHLYKNVDENFEEELKNYNEFEF
jgi:hypothetical protein